MTEFIFLIVGLLLGGCVGAIVMCCLQINRLNQYHNHKEEEHEKKY